MEGGVKSGQRTGGCRGQKSQQVNCLMKSGPSKWRGRRKNQAGKEGGLTNSYIMSGCKGGRRVTVESIPTYQWYQRLVGKSEGDYLRRRTWV